MLHYHLSKLRFPQSGHHLLHFVLLLKIYLDNDTIVVSNNINKKNLFEETSKIGLDNLSKRYKYLSQKDIEITNNNKEFIKEEAISFLSASWSSFDYPENTCKRDVVHILDASITDIVYGGNERTINAGVFYWKYPSEATGSQLFPTLDGIEYAGEVAQKVISGAVFVPPTSEKVNAYNLVLENRDLIQNEVIEYVHILKKK